MSTSRLTVLLGADSLLGRRSGVGRMTWQIARHAREHPEIGTLRLLASASILPPDWLDGLEQGGGGDAPGSGETGLRERIGRVPGAAALRSAWLRRRLNRAARALPDPVVYHEPNLIARPFDGATVLTINDLSWRVDRGFHPDRRAAWIERRLPGSIAQATRFVAISAFTAGEMTRDLGIPRERIDVVPLAPSAVFRPVSPAEADATLHAHGLRAGGFVLSVSTLEPRKNFDRLLAAHSLLPDALRERHPLTIAGGAGWGSALEGEMAGRAQRAGYLRLLGHVADQELVALYSQCSAFAFPSLYEGFGLPVIEAMACGAPVIAAATTATGETAGDAALLVDPLDEHAIADALRTVLEDPSSADRLRRLGLARAATFTWEGTITRLIASWRRGRGGR
jgi:alpha-1,3-rhamnosyl/mannosyltransferase